MDEAENVAVPWRWSEEMRSSSWGESLGRGRIVGEGERRLEQVFKLEQLPMNADLKKK